MKNFLYREKIFRVNIKKFYVLCLICLCCESPLYGAAVALEEGKELIIIQRKTTIKARESRIIN